MTDFPVTHFDQSTFLAARVAAATAIGDPHLAHEFVLPGARVAISRERLEAYHAAGLGEHEIRGLINARHA